MFERQVGLLRSGMMLRGILMLLVVLSFNAQAAKQYSPSDVYSGLAYANKIAEGILASKNISDMSLPKSKETAAKPMHVYELHSSILNELHKYALSNSRRPPR